MCTVYINTLKSQIRWLTVCIIDVFGVSFFEPSLKEQEVP
jgi:hypothetical protein